MVGISSHHNAGNTPYQKRISVYYSLRNGNLALQQRTEYRDNANDLEETDLYVSSNDDRKGWIENPSQLASTQMDGVSIVFGFTPKAKGDTLPTTTPSLPETQHDIVMLSPVYRHITSTDIGNKTIVADTVRDMTSVLYLSGGNGNPISIKEHWIGNLGNNEESYEFEDHLEILEGSSLATTYCTGQVSDPLRHVVYQAKNASQLRECSSDGSDNLILKGQVKVGSPLALDVNGQRTHLYYLDPGNILYTVVKKYFNSQEWGEPMRVKEAIREVAHESQLTATTANDYCHIFYFGGEKASDGTSDKHIKGALEHVIDQMY